MFPPFSVTGSSLELLKAGEKGIVTFCKSDNEIIQKKLIAMGVKPGTAITLKKRFPSFIVKVGNTSLAIDKEITRAIYVRIISDISH
ncbi:MAG: FeoA family protein [Heteroscytonema crispum UTEX LB 1556]